MAVKAGGIAPLQAGAGEARARVTPQGRARSESDRRVPKTERAAGGLGRLETGGLVDWTCSHTASKPESAAWPSHATEDPFGGPGSLRGPALRSERLRQLSHWWRV